MSPLPEEEPVVQEPNEGGGTRTEGEAVNPEQTAPLGNEGEPTDAERQLDERSDEE